MGGRTYQEDWGVPNGDSITPLTGIAVVRPDDLLDLTFEFRNLGLRRSGPPALVRVDPAASALVIVGFPPQSVGEGPSEGIEAGLPLPSALSDASRLAFVVNSAVTEIPFTLDGLLDWSRLTPNVAAEAIGVPPFSVTSIEAPWRLILTTGTRARWVSPRRAVTRGGVTELWCSRLDPGLPASDRVLRPLWSPDLLSPTTMRAALTVGDRQNIVTRGGGIPPNNATPVIARRLELSTRGAWMDVDGGWNEPDPEIPGGLDISALGHDIDELFKFPGPPLTDEELRAEASGLVDRAINDLVPASTSADVRLAMRRVVLERIREEVEGRAGQLAGEVLGDMPPRPRFEWSHRLLQGRDDRVRTVTPGILLPWGFAVDLVRETARSFVSFFPFEAASLITRASIRVRESARSFSASQYPFGGHETPFGSARLTGDTNRAVRSPDDTASPFWVRTSDGAADLGWTVVLSDRAFRPVTVTMPMLFVPLAFARAPGGSDAAWSTFTSDARSEIDLGGQTVTLTEGDQRGTTALEVHTMTIGGAAPSSGGRAPMLSSAEVSVSAVNALLGTAGVSARVPFKFHDSFLEARFDAARNPAQVFADLRGADLDITSLPERAGGLMRPDLAVQGLSKLLGPVADIENVALGKLVPDSFIPDVKILGGISLKSLIAPFLSGLTPGDLGALADLEPDALWAKLQEQAVSLPMPALTSRKIGPVEAPTAVETRFVWKPKLDLDKVLPRGLELDRTARLVVLSTIQAPLDGSAPTFESTGVLANFAIHFARVVKVQLETLTFVARAGRKLELDAKGVRLTFEGSLAFVEEIRNHIPPQGFSDLPSVAVTPMGITAGYSLGLPPIGVGVFSLENVGLSAALELPFVDGPTRLRFQLSERHDPFLVTVSLFGGGGFFGITVDTEGAVGVEAALEFGGNFCLDLLVASGGVHVMAGIYFRMAGTVVELSGYLRAGGAVTVLGVITVSVEFYLALTYTHSDGPPKLNKVSGEAVLTVGVDVLFLHQDVTLRVHREFASPASDPTSNNWSRRTPGPPTATRTPPDMPTAVVTALALPHGIAASGARRVSIVLTPRLEGDDGERLEHFPAMLDWPAAIGHPEVGFLVEVEGHGAISTRVVSARPSSPRWSSMFRAGHTVTPDPAMGTDERVLITYPYADLARDLERRYGEVGAASVTRPPSRSEIVASLDDLMRVARRGSFGSQTSEEHLGELLELAEEQVARRLAERLADPAFDAGPPVVLGDGEPAGLPRDLDQFEAFHHVFAAQARQLATDAPRERPHVDFHKAVAALGDHAWLLRELGLVLDLELVGPPFASSAADPGRLRVVPSWNGHEPEDIEVVSRWVAYVASPTSFHTADRPDRAPGERQVDGLVAIGEGGWDLVQVDVDGGILKLLGAAATAADRADAARAKGGPVGGVEALPALRSGGLTLARRSSAVALGRSMGEQHRLVAADPDDDAATLFASDVTRGYRMDIRESRTGSWRSLLARVVQATVDGHPPLPLVHDEGVVRRGVRHAPPRDPSQPPVGPMYVHDALGRWDGWSLAAPHPGLAISKDGRAPDQDHPETMPVQSHNPSVDDGVPFSIEPRVEPGSLPRLRYGERYHVRLRTVDLAGNGPTLAEADLVTAADQGHRLVLPLDDGGLLVVRYEPVGSPELVCREMVGPGESLAHLVIRSDAGAGVSAAQWAESNGIGGATCERHVVPPKASQLQAERHGMFDTSIGTGVGAAATYEIARREAGQLHHSSTRMRDGSIRQRRARLEETPAGSYVIDPDQDLVIPYLPDPVAEAVTVFGAPSAPAGTLVRMEADGTSSVPSPAPLDAGATPEALLRVGFGDPDLWPDLLPFRLVLAEGDAPPRWDPGVRALVLSLPPGGRCRIELSCAPSPAHIDELAPRAWARGRHPDAEHVALVEAGRVWQISPARHVELVHAVQRPVEAPVISLLVPSRSPGDTSVLLEGTIEVHGATSERLDLVATWEEPAGRGSDTSPRQRHAHVFEQPLLVSYDPLPDDLAAPSAELDGIRYEEQTDSVRLTIPPPRVPGEPVRPARTPRHELGDKRHRKITYEAVATSRFREYLPDQVWADPSNVTRRSAPFVVDVPSTAAPVAPSVVQVLPTFAWMHDVPEGSGTQSVRRGGGLRVYLEPPWFSSGEGELLGVVLRPAEVTEPRDDRMTRWGMDPIWEGGTPTKWPNLADALNPASTARGLRLGPGGPQVDVAGYPVAWDDERKLWSSDIALDVRRTHTPFVRLALVRWQPSSLPGLELSPLVLAELAQPAPDRVLTILRSSPPRFGEAPDLSNSQPQLMDIRLRLQGPGPSTRTTVTVQRRMQRTLDEVGWVDVTGPGITVGTEMPASEVRWAARVHFDDVNSAKFRLLVRETEVFPDGRERTLFLETIRP